MPQLIARQNCHKKEFPVEKKEVLLTVRQIIGSFYLNHQQILNRLMNSEINYNSLLI